MRSLILLPLLLTSVFSVHIYALVSEDANAQIGLAKELQLHNDPVWKSLLHFSNSTFRINDESFLLSHNNPSLELELEENIRNIQRNSSNRFVCRFPARYTWLKSKLDLPEIDLKSCDELNLFKNNAPADKISVVYASENLTSPSSMMGHVLLRIQGDNQSGKNVDHAISFFTVTDGINPASLLFQTMVIGKQGFYTLSPYHEKLRRYLEDEQRSIWEYFLNLNDFQKELIHLHLYEMKSIKLKYFFNTYNCSTLINFIVSIATPEMREPEGLWITPIDVIKGLNSHGSVTSTQVIPSNKWLIRLISDELTSEQNVSLKKSIENLEASSLPVAKDIKEKVYFYELSMAYSDYLENDNKLKKIKIDEFKQKISKIYNFDREKTFIDIGKYKTPLKTQQDSQVSVGLSRFNDTNFIRTNFLPASHKLEDDNRQYFTENDLRLADFSLVTDIETNKTYFDSFKLYSIQSVTPRNYFTGGISGKFSIGAKKQFELPDSPISVDVNGGVGFAYRFSKDVDIYGLFSGGIGYISDHTYSYGEPEIGIIFREVYDMKTIVKYRHTWNYLDQFNKVDFMKITQSKYINHRSSLHLSYTKWSNDISRERYDISYKYFF
ncbi:MAG: DUF4105 domain-containing protein [Gammaproteobacteria bacterium]|nr:DUF4105 domain-containing protein [Gammaproteobacteria bacterium]